MQQQSQQAESSSAVVPFNPKGAQIEATQNYRKSAAVAGLCKEIVTRTAVTISGRKYVPAPSWEAIAVAHGCVVGTRDVQRVDGGIRCIAELKNIETGQVIAEAEGFVGEDEPVWFGGEADVWDNQKRAMVKKTYQKRPEFAIRAMCQTRAAGRVCKQAFAHVVVMMNANLETTPLEEVADPENPQETASVEPRTTTSGERPPPLPIFDWKDVHIHFGKKHGPGCDGDHPKGKQLGELGDNALKWYQENYEPKEFRGKFNPDDLRLRRALDISMGKAKPDPRPEQAKPASEQPELVREEVPAAAKQVAGNEPPD